MTETELMLTLIRNCRRVDLYVDPPPLDSFQAKQLEEFHRRRENHEPLQYILGSCEFLGLKFQVDPRVLIPRPETEILVEAVILSFPNAFPPKADLPQRRISLWLKPLAEIGNPDEALTGPPIKTFGGDRPINILDLGTGSGNIAIAFAKYLKQCHVTAVDFFQGCLDLASLNATMNSVPEKIEFIRSDLFSSLNSEYPGKKFDILISNPPYISTAELDFLPADVRCEPRAALDGGKDGLDFYRRIFAGCRPFLKPKGFLFLEIGCDQTDALKSMLGAFSYLEFLDVRKDLCGRERVLIVRKN